MKTFCLPNIDTASRLFHELATRAPKVGPCRVEWPLVLYGAGNLGRLAANLLQRLDVPVAYAMDRLPPSDGLLLGHIPVLEPERAPLEHRNDHLIGVCVVNVPYQPIHDTLARMGWRYIYPIYDILEAYTHRMSMNNGWFTGTLDDQDIAGIDEVLSCWHDDFSRAAHLQFLAWRIHREEWYFPNAPVSIDDRYFIESVRWVLQPNEYFLDAGAHHGMIIERWLKLTKGKFREILAVEPDRDNVKELRAGSAKFPIDINERIRILQSALGAYDGIKPFNHGFGLASRLATHADEQTLVCRLDDLDFPVTFGKFHLEGGELQALEGGKGTLRQHRPLLAITLYHNRDGLWRIPLFLIELLPDYRFILRLHGWCGTACVLYGIPNERGKMRVF